MIVDGFAYPRHARMYRFLASTGTGDVEFRYLDLGGQHVPCLAVSVASDFDPLAFLSAEHGERFEGWDSVRLKDQRLLLLPEHVEDADFDPRRLKVIRRNVRRAAEGMTEAAGSIADGLGRVFRSFVERFP